jgi:acyl-coenzyme A thioesterase PaaI-like protein
MSLELPHTAGCLVCGPGNNKGLRLKLFVDPGTGVVETKFAPGKEHIGFQGVTHGGVLAAVLDEVMVWAASWAGKRFCLCGEMSVRFRQKAEIDQPLTCTARVEVNRSKLISTVGEARDPAGRIVATATGKYIPLTREENQEYVRTFVSDPETVAAAEMMRGGV